MAYLVTYLLTMGKVMFEKMIKELGKRMDTQSKKLFFFFIKD